MPSTSWLEVFAAAIAGDDVRARAAIAADPACIAERADHEAFDAALHHQLYVGDTLLHIAAAAHQPGVVAALLAAGAAVDPANRRGARPLHYAVDGSPGPAWRPADQVQAIAVLLDAGADVEAVDANGTRPVHRAVRNRCSGAVELLLRRGADPRAPNGSGNTARELAVATTGRGGVGSAAARAEQDRIIALLRDRA